MGRELTAKGKRKLEKLVDVEECPEGKAELRASPRDDQVQGHSL